MRKAHPHGGGGLMCKVCGPETLTPVAHLRGSAIWGKGIRRNAYNCDENWGWAIVGVLDLGRLGQATLLALNCQERWDFRNSWVTEPHAYKICASEVGGELADGVDFDREASTTGDCYSSSSPLNTHLLGANSVLVTGNIKIITRANSYWIFTMYQALYKLHYHI